ncbi:MAG: ATPase [Bacillota bacterium]
MDTDLIALLDRLEDLVNNSMRVPLTGKVLVDEDEVYDLIDSARELIPEEVREAKWVARERERLLEDARQEALRILEDARQEAAATLQDAEESTARLADESAIMEKARLKSEEIVNHARGVAREIHEGAQGYAADLLDNLNSFLMKAHEAIEEGRRQLGVKPGDDAHGKDD